MNARLVVRKMVLMLCVSAMLACGSEADKPKTDKEGGREAENTQSNEVVSRFARKYLPFEPAWVPESEIPRGAPSSPQMVIWEVSRFDPRVAATPDQQQAADAFVARSFEAALAKNWFDRSKGLADGFTTPGSDSRHHRNDAFVLDGIQLDPERPEYLMYYPDPNRDGEQTLTGLMFLADGQVKHGHQFGGPLAIWHYHKYKNARCWAKRGLLSSGMVDAQGRCPIGSTPINRSPEMVHVWLIDHPRGPFSTGMTLPEDVLREGLAKRREELGF